MKIEDILFNILVLAIGRSLDLFSTWYCSPNFDIELNSWMKRVGWKNVILINIIIVPIFSIAMQERNILWGVLSSLMALRNFQVGTMARAMGEQAYLNAYRKFVRDSPWYVPLIPIFVESFIYIAIGGTIILIISKPETQNLNYVGTIGAAFLCLGLIVSFASIGQRIEKKYFSSN
jgi:hypothetical protein